MVVYDFSSFFLDLITLVCNIFKFQFFGSITVTSCNTILLRINTAFFVVDSISNCRSTIGKPGTCIVYDKCEYARNLMRTKGSFSQEYLRFLNHSICGFQGFTPKVCCLTAKVQKTVQRPYNAPHKPTTTKSPPTSTKPTIPKIMKVQKTFPKISTTLKPTTKKLQFVKSTVTPVVTKSTNQETRKAHVKKNLESVTPSLLPKKCDTRNDKRMVGGESVRLNEFPWVALLEYENKGII